MQLQRDTVYILAEIGDKAANLALELSKDIKTPIFWFDQEVDINFGEFFVKTDDIEYGDLD